MVNALSSFIASFGKDTHDAQQLVDGWHTAAWASDGGFWHDMPPDDSPAAHQPVWDDRSDPLGDAQDGHRTEPRIGASLDAQMLVFAGDDIEGHGGIRPAHRRRLDVRVSLVCLLPAPAIEPRAHSPSATVTRCRLQRHRTRSRSQPHLQMERSHRTLLVGSAARATLSSCRRGRFGARLSRATSHVTDGP